MTSIKDIKKRNALRRQQEATLAKGSSESAINANQGFQEEDSVDGPSSLLRKDGRYKVSVCKKDWFRKEYKNEFLREYLLGCAIDVLAEKYRLPQEIAVDWAEPDKNSALFRRINYQNNFAHALKFALEGALVSRCAKYFGVPYHTLRRAKLYEVKTGKKKPARHAGRPKNATKYAEEEMVSILSRSPPDNAAFWSPDTVGKALGSQVTTETVRNALKRIGVPLIQSFFDATWDFTTDDYKELSKKARSKGAIFLLMVVSKATKKIDQSEVIITLLARSKSTRFIPVSYFDLLLYSEDLPIWALFDPAQKESAEWAWKKPNLTLAIADELGFIKDIMLRDSRTKLRTVEFIDLQKKASRRTS